MAKLVVKLAAAFLCIVSSTSSYGLASLCSSEFLPLAGQTTLTHEVVWSYHDNWFSDMYTEVRTAITPAGAAPSAPLERSDHYVMGNGGSALHYLQHPVAGEYSISGSVQIGYPQAWGFDGYFGVACPLWQGHIDNTADNIAADEIASTSSIPAIGVQTDALIPCSSSVTPECAAIDATLPASGKTGPGTGKPDSADASRRSSIVVTGFIQAADNDVLILFTSTGQYVTFSVPLQYQIARHTDVDVSEVVPGDVVAVVQEPAEGAADKTETEVTRLLVYRGGTEDAIPTAQPATATEHLAKAVPGVALPGVVKRVGRDALGGTVRLMRGDAETSLRLASHPVVTLITPADFSQLQPFSVEARVVAQPQDDGTLLVRSIEILQSHGGLE